MKLSDTQIAAYAKMVGFPNSVIAVVVAIALAESGGDPAAVNTANSNGTTDSGLMQINSSHASEFPLDYPLRFVPLSNMRMAKALYTRRGNSFADWSTYTNGSYARFLSRGAATGGATVNTSNLVENTLDTAFWAKQGVIVGAPAPTGWVIPSRVNAGTGPQLGPYWAQGRAYANGDQLDAAAGNGIIVVFHSDKDGNPIDSAVIADTGIVRSIDSLETAPVLQPHSGNSILSDTLAKLGLSTNTLWIAAGALLVILGLVILASKL